MKNKNEVFIRYRIDKDSIVFWCSDISINNSATTVLNNFLYDFSLEKNIFFHGYRLPEEHLPKMVDTKAILEKSEIILDPFNILLHLSNAKININYFDYACETMIYYFDNNIKWTDFLATSIINQPINYIKNGTLLAYFASVDQGADYWFECSKDYEENVLKLLHELSVLGCRIEQVSHLSFPYSI